MKVSGFIESVITIFTVVALVTSGFLGFLVMQGILDEDGVVAVTRKVGTDQTYATISAAITAANPDDVIEVHAGTYNENVLVNKRLTLIGNGTTNTTINGGGTGDVVVISADDVNITGFLIFNSGTAAAPNYDAGIEVNNANNARIYGNNISGNRDGIFLNSADNCVIENNICYANSVNGITLFFSYFNRLENNSCTYNNNTASVSRTAIKTG